MPIDPVLDSREEISSGTKFPFSDEFHAFCFYYHTRCGSPVPKEGGLCLVEKVSGYGALHDMGIH